MELEILLVLWCRYWHWSMVLKIEREEIDITYNKNKCIGQYYSEDAEKMYH